MHSQVRNKNAKWPIVLSALAHKENIFKLAVLEPRYGAGKSSNDYKDSQIKLKLDQTNVLDKIDSHKQTRELIFTYLLQTTISKDKLKHKLKKIEGQLKQEKI